MNVKTTKLPHEFASVVGGIVGGTTETYIAIYDMSMSMNSNNKEDKKNGSKRKNKKN